jgi:hypothetical protein
MSLHSSQTLFALSPQSGGVLNEEATNTNCKVFGLNGIRDLPHSMANTPFLTIYFKLPNNIYIYIHVQVIICQHIFTSMQKSILVSDFMYTMTVRKQSDKSIIHTIEQVQRSRVLRSNDSL